MVAIVLTILGAAAGLTWIYLFGELSATRPGSPQPALGQVIEQDNHGHIFYISSQDQNLLWHRSFVAIIMLIAGGFLWKENR
jgi:hypothetical protein